MVPVKNSDKTHAHDDQKMCFIVFFFVFESNVWFSIDLNLVEWIQRLVKHQNHINLIGQFKFITWSIQTRIEKSPIYYWIPKVSQVHWCYMNEFFWDKVYYLKYSS